MKTVNLLRLIGKEEIISRRSDYRFEHPDRVIGK
jgi:hypothetical protein